MTTRSEEPRADHPGSGPEPGDFIRTIVSEDLASGKHRRVVTRFPPEPNGYLHIGHAKSICLNFGLAQEVPESRCHLRFDDTNPTTEDMEYVQAIQRDVHWLGFDWGEHLYFASDYFEELYRFAVELIEAGKAYVDDLSEEEIRELRGTVSEPGRASPWRDRTVEENLDLFARMRAGELPDGSRVLRARIDMGAANMKMRDPILYRIRRASHYRTGDDWCIYPMYDHAHGLSDAVEGITHSLCTLEFENNRELYDWILDNVTPPSRPRQIEFARLNLSYTLLSKRRLLELVEKGAVEGWDDPRMPTLSGLRRRGYTPGAIRDFCDRIGVAKANSTVDVALLEHSIRDDLNREAPRVLCVLRPLKVVIENYPEGQSEELPAPFFPRDVPREGSRMLPFSRVLYIEREDFEEEPPKGFYRLAPGREVRLRYAYLVRCVGVVKDEASGEVVELRCTYDPDTRGGSAPDGRKVKGTIHWVSAAHAEAVEVRLYDRLFSVERPDLVRDGTPQEELLNPESLTVLPECWAEPGVAGAEPGSRFQFERHGYFYLDPDAAPGRAVFNRIVALRDTWAKVAGRRDGEGRRESPAPAPQREQAGKAPGAAGEAAAGPSPEERARDLDAAARAAYEEYTGELGLSSEDALLLAEDPGLRRLFAEARAVRDNPQGIANWIVNELLRELKDRRLDELSVGGGELGELVALIDAGTISGRIAKEVLAAMLQGEGGPGAIVEKKGLRQIADPGELGAVVDRVLAENPGQLADYRAGKQALFGYFVGQVMRHTGGKADPALTTELLGDRLGRG